MVYSSPLITFFVVNLSWTRVPSSPEFLPRMAAVPQSLKQCSGLPRHHVNRKCQDLYPPPSTQVPPTHCGPSLRNTKVLLQASVVVPVRVLGWEDLGSSSCLVMKQSGWSSWGSLIHSATATSSGCCCHREDHTQVRYATY